MRDVALPLARSYEPELVLVSAGYDAHAEDPLADCAVTDAGFAAMTALVRDLGASSSAGRLRARGRLRRRRARPLRRADHADAGVRLTPGPDRPRSTRPRSAVHPLAAEALARLAPLVAGYNLAAMSERSYGTRRRARCGRSTIEPGFVRTATGSALISVGETRVICTASVQESVPRWMTGRGRGWVTAEYGMLPASTGERKQRDISKGKADGRSVEIQRLIGRSLRGVVDFEALGERTIYIDCDVLQADGGTRCASITGGMVALELAIAKLVGDGLARALAADR